MLQDAIPAGALHSLTIFSNHSTPVDSPVAVLLAWRQLVGGVTVAADARGPEIRLYPVSQLEDGVLLRMLLLPEHGDDDDLHGRGNKNVGGR